MTYLPTIRKVSGERTEKRNTIVKFTNRKMKDEVLCNGRLLKRSQVFANEHLTTKNDISGKLGP